MIDQHVEPIQRSAVMSRVTGDLLIQTLKPGERWPVQQALAMMRFDLLKSMVAQGMIPVAPMQFDMQFRFEQRAVSDTLLEAFNGKRMEVPDSMHQLVYTTSTRDAGWLPLTDKEKSYGS